MSDFINTVDIIDDDILMDGLIERSISGSFNDNKITTIKNGAFAYCTNLESVCFPNVTTIGAGAFTGSGLKAITPETFPSVTSIGYLYGSYVFGESALETVDWPSLTVENDYHFFHNCKSLRSVNLPNLTSFGNYGASGFLDGCTSLTYVNLPLLPHSPSCAGCTSLRLIDLPSCTSFYNGNFVDCLLDALIIRNTTMCTLNNAFYNNNIAKGTGYIYVPRELVDSYKTATNWSTHATQIRPLEDYTVDGTITGAMREHCDSLALNVTELTFTDANSQTLAITTPMGVLDEITWTTSDKTVAGVNNGVVTPVNDGTATITVTCGEHSATCAVTVNAGLDVNILRNVGFNAGYLSNNGNATNGGTGDAYTDKFDISNYVGTAIEVQLIDVTNTASNSRICYYNSSNTCVGYTQATTASYGAVITSTVPDNATYAAISVNKSGGFSAIGIYCDGVRIGYIDYTS